MWLIRYLSLEKRAPKTSELWGDWSVFFIGATERAVALALVLTAPPYLPAFVGGWILLKFALDWQRAEKGDDVMTDSMLAMVGNVLSFAVAIGAGIILNPIAIKLWASPH